MVGADDVSAFALNRLDKDGRDFFRSEDGLEELVFNVAGAAEGELLSILRPTRATAIDIGIADVRHARHERRETALLLRLGGGQRERAHGASVEGAQKGDHLLALGVIARQFQRALDRLRAGVAVVDLVRPGHGSDLRQPLGERHHALVVKVGARHVDQFARLLLNGGDDLGMAVTGGGHGDAGGEIEEFVAVHVFDDDAAAALGDHRVGTRVGRRNVLVIARENALGVGAGDGGVDLGADSQSLGGHGSSPKCSSQLLSSQFSVVERGFAQHGCCTG